VRQQVDYLKECMSDPALTKAGPVPLDVFNRSYCVVCGNRECSRSALNGMAFDARVLNWKKDMFDSVPRADEADTGYDRIREKRFLPVQGQGQPVSTQAWIPELRHGVLIQESEPEPPAATAHSEEPSPAPPAPPAQAARPNQPAPRQAGDYTLENTPFVQGTVLPGGQPAPAGTGKDVVLNPGGSFTFGSDDE